MGGTRYERHTKDRVPVLKERPIIADNSWTLARLLKRQRETYVDPLAEKRFRAKVHLAGRELIRAHLEPDSD